MFVPKYSPHKRFKYSVADEQYFMRLLKDPEWDRTRISQVYGVRPGTLCNMIRRRAPELIGATGRGRPRSRYNTNKPTAKGRSTFCPECSPPQRITKATAHGPHKVGVALRFQTDGLGQVWESCPRCGYSARCIVAA